MCVEYVFIYRSEKLWDISDREKRCLMKIFSVQFSHSVVSNSLRPHGLQHARFPCPSPTPKACSNSCPSTQWCHPIISSSVIPFSSCLQSFPASGSFQMSHLFASGSQSIGVSASASVLPINIQDWFPWLVWSPCSPVQFSSVAQSCPTHCNPMNHSTPGLSVHQQLPESTQTHVLWVGDAIQPSHPLASPSHPALNLFQHQGLFKWVSSLHQMAKVLEFQLQNQSFQWIFRTDFL